MDRSERWAVRGVVLDVDGTLVESNAAHARAWVNALAESGRDVKLETVLRCIGMGSDKLLPEVARIEKDSPEGKQLTQRRSAIFREQELPNLRPTPGAQALLQRLHDEGMHLVVASSAEADELEALLDVAGARELVEETTSSDEAEQSKPDPDIVQAALQKLGVPPSECLMLGDTPYDVEAALRAGLRIVGVRSGGWDDAGLHGAVAVYADPADLLAHLEASPFASTTGGVSRAA